MSRYQFLMPVTLLATALAAAPAYANNEAMIQLLKVLKEKGTIDQQTYEQLAGVARADDEQNSSGQEKVATDVKKQQKELAEIKSNSASGWWNDTKISGRMYSNLSYVQNERSGATQSNNGPGFDVKRFYVSIDHKFNDTFAADVTTDFTYDSTTKATQLFLKKAYLDININPAFDLRLGSTDLPWIPFVEGIYGRRYVENVIVDRTKFGTSADWGVHANGKLANGLVNYAVSVVNGAGYKNPNALGHTNSMDFEGRVSLNLDKFVLATGGYVGKLGKDVEGTSTPHTATRFDALAAYVGDPLRVGVEYFRAWDWMNVASTTSDSSEGVSAFGSYAFAPQWAVFGRYDYVMPTKDTNNNLEDNYFNVGLEYSPAKIVDFSLVYKRDHAAGGFLSTSNGTIGSLSATSGTGTYDEVGLFSRFRW